MSAFAAAAAVLAADPNLGTDATFTPAGGGGSLALRVVLSRPEEAMGALDALRGLAGSARAMVPASALTAAPVRGDAITIGGTAYLVAEAAQDEIAASWTLHLRRAPPAPPPSTP